VILRGVNKMAVYADRAGDSFPEIASVGANSVRFMWMLDVAASEAVQTLQRAVDSDLIPIWEIHDATGNFSRMPDVAAFWTNPATIAVLQQFESRVLVNLANEAGDFSVDDTVWLDTYTSLIEDLRAAGLRMTFIVDAAGWGRNVEQLLRLAPQLIENDPLHNLMFSWHVYNPGPDEAARVDTSIAAAIAAQIPFLIGEFGPVSPGLCDAEVPYLDIIESADANGIGYLPWSWDNFNGDCNTGSGSAFDMVSDGIHASTLNAGYATEVVLTHPSSIQNTSVLTTFQLTGSCD
jgi:mannan endo-1,4-beta-mannosidase